MADDDITIVSRPGPTQDSAEPVVVSRPKTPDDQNIKIVSRPPDAKQSVWDRVLSGVKSAATGAADAMSKVVTGDTETMNKVAPFIEKNIQDFGKDKPGGVGDYMSQGSNPREAAQKALRDPRNNEENQGIIGFAAPIKSVGSNMAESLFGAGGGKKPPTPPPDNGPPSGAPPNITPPAERPAPPGPSEPPPVEGPLAKPPVLTEPRAFEDQLYQLQQNNKADKVEVLKRLKAVPEGVAPETWEKLYHYEESPKTTELTPEEKALYDEHVKPIAAEADRLSGELEGMGYPVDKVETTKAGKAAIDTRTREMADTPTGERLPSSEGYTPRYVLGKTRSFGEVLNQWKKGVEAKFGGAPGRSMRKTVDAQQSRRYYIAKNDETGESHVVYVAPGGDVMPFDGTTAKGKDFDLGKIGTVQGRLAPGTKFKGNSFGPYTKEGAPNFTLENATTKQIEEVARTRYSKNVLANRLDNVTKLRAAVRNAKFIEQMKASPDWNKVAIKADEVSMPPQVEGREWRVPKGPLQMRGYYMEPYVADALEDFAAANRSVDGLADGLDKVANVIKGSIFWWPLPHMLNTFDHFIVSKGLAGNIKGLATGSSARAIVKAIRAVATQNADYMRSLRAGASLPYAEQMTRDVHKALIAKLGEAVKSDPKSWMKAAQAFGYANPINLIKGIYEASSKALWSSTDVMNLARIFEEQEKGLSLGDAIKKVERHMPNYRIPGQVMGSRTAAQILSNPLFTMFGRYQYNRLASYGHMVKGLVSKLPEETRAETLDKLAMLGFMGIVAYPAIDEAVKKITDNPNASFRRPGASAIPKAIYDVAVGEKSPTEGMQSIYSMGPLPDLATELYHGNYGWSGQPVARVDDLKRGDKQFLYDIFSWIGSHVQPIGMAAGAMQGKQTAGQMLDSLFNIKAPTPEQAATKERYKQKDKTDAIKRDAREEAKRENRSQP